MAVFIPEWSRLSGRDLHIKRLLGTLDDTYTVRRPMTPSRWAPDLFLHHRPSNSWLAVTICDTPFSPIDPQQLFGSEERDTFEQALTRLRVLEGMDPSIVRRLRKVLLMWMCSPHETSILSATYARFSVDLLAKESFMQSGAGVLTKLLSPLSEDEEATLLGHYFSEAEIPVACTVRRDFHQDNSAKLTRIFLDVEQEWASKLDLEPPPEQAEAAKDFSMRLVNGVAGSGKTLIALNRARLLASIYPQQHILVLIHNTPIVADVHERLNRALGGVPENLEITTFFGWAVQQWRRIFEAQPRMPKHADVVLNLIKHYRSHSSTLQGTEEQLLAEMDFINNVPIRDATRYLTADRTGQGFALREKERIEVWKLYEEVTGALHAQGLRMWSALPRDICLAHRHDRLQKYDHILVDEAQFFFPAWFQVVRLALKPEGHLFLCADPNQGFMKSRLSWKSAGLDVAGRTKKLRKSYRTTRALLFAANRILAQFTRDDPEDFLQPDFDGMRTGSPPLLAVVASPQDAVDRLANEIAGASRERLPLSSMLVIHGESVDKTMLAKRIGAKIGANNIWWLNDKEQKKMPPGGYGRDYLRIASLNSATGLEGSVVFLIGLEHLLSERRSPCVSDEEHARKQEDEARKLYMAMTRAGQRLLLISSQRCSSAVESAFEKAEGWSVQDVH